MSDEKKEKGPKHPETNFLPPLNMFLAFFDKKKKKKGAKQEVTDEKNVEKLIEKLSESEEETKK
jgi:hypothetical protein